MITRVVKFGGSLLQVPEIASCLQDWLQVQDPAKNVFVAGGGNIVETIRHWQNRFELSDEACHWMSIDAMSLTAKLLNHLLPGSVLTDKIIELRNTASDLIVFETIKWLRGENSLPESWAVTSDSIAAALVRLLDAEELVLLKSKLPDAGCRNLAQLSASGFTDQYFATVAAGLPRLRIVNLRETNQEIDLVPDPKQATL